jgi:hypothetical protein
MFQLHLTREAVDKRSFRYATKSVADMSSDPTSTSASDATEAEVTVTTFPDGTVTVTIEPP